MYQRQKLQKQQRLRPRGPYTKKACTNCQQRHVKCSGKATCERCTLYKIECTFIESKKRGPKTDSRLLEQVIFNDSEIGFNETTIPSSVNFNAIQSYALPLPFLPGHQFSAQRLENNNNFILDPNLYQNNHASQEINHQEYDTDSREEWLRVLNADDYIKRVFNSYQR
ncbi:185_t:CDS:1 [Scutellospora calospora]|uniref:185_t:CDS:1 n=1 Tax=Scutellospora calospora TaxID=85575 RepID=A0ACA9JVE7_9GLOM|nr:185_t:CDS:1 [Scutellospora calospora]